MIHTNDRLLEAGTDHKTKRFAVQVEVNGFGILCTSPSGIDYETNGLADIQFTEEDLNKLELAIKKHREGAMK